MLRHPSLIPLSQQHQHGLALCVAVRRSLAVDRTAKNLARLAREVAAAYEAELANHFATEEHNHADAFDDLTELQRHSEELKEKPGAFGTALPRLARRRRSESHRCKLIQIFPCTPSAQFPSKDNLPVPAAA